MLKKYTFPSEKIVFYLDFHINITIEFVKSSNISRLNINNHINYSFKS